MTKLVRMSHSRYETYSTCGERYRLQRIVKVPTTPGIYAVAGTAFHEWSEFYDLDPTHPDWLDEAWWEVHLTRLVRAEEEESGIPLAQWDTPARKPGANQAAFEKFRDELGPEWIRMYIEWRTTSGWTLAELPPDAPPTDRDGNPTREPRTVGVEYRIPYRVGTVDDVAIIDRIFVTPEETMPALDIKTWSKKRVTPQLPSYVVAARQNGIPVSHAGYYEARKGEVTGLEEFKYWSENTLAALHEQAAHMMAAGFFLPRPSEDCRSICPVRRHCAFAL